MSVYVHIFTLYILPSLFASLPFSHLRYSELFGVSLLWTPFLAYHQLTGMRDRWSSSQSPFTRTFLTMFLHCSVALQCYSQWYSKGLIKGGAMSGIWSVLSVEAGYEPVVYSYMTCQNISGGDIMWPNLWREVMANNLIPTLWYMHDILHRLCSGQEHFQGKKCRDRVIFVEPCVSYTLPSYTQYNISLTLCTNSFLA